MAERQYRTLTKRTVDRLSVNGKDAIFWDRDLPGFGVRVYPTRARRSSSSRPAPSAARSASASASMATPTSPPITPSKKATEIIARIKIGQPPVPPEPAPDPTVADLAERYQREYVAMHCKPLTITHYRLMLRKHIVPALGERLVADIEYKDILAFHNSLHHMPTVANRTADILVKMFNLSDAWGWRPSGTNPCRGVPRFRVEKHERFLTREELYRLGEALRAAPRRASRLGPFGGGHSPPRAHRMPPQRNPRSSLGRPELRHRRDAPPRFEDRHADGSADPAAARVLNGLSRTPGNPWVFPAGRRAPGWSTSTTPGTASASTPGSKTSACMT